MRSVSEQPSAAGVADQLHGKISEKLASAVWIRPVGRLSGHFTELWRKLGDDGLRKAAYRGG
jgi:hypothetical protein